LFTTILSAKEFNIVSWNAKDFGKSRDANEMEAIANLLKGYDLIAIQEVVAKDPGGVSLVVRSRLRMMCLSVWMIGRVCCRRVVLVSGSLQRCGSMWRCLCMGWWGRWLTEK